MNWRGDHCDLICSPLGGYSRLGYPFVISFVDGDGNIDRLQLMKICEDIRDMGFNGLRDFAWWIDTTHNLELLKPFIVMPQKNSNPLAVYPLFQDKFIDNWVEAAKIINAHGLMLHLSLFEGNQVRLYPGVSPWGWWKHQFYDDDIAYGRRQLIRRIVKAFQKNKIVVTYETCNEPQFTDGVTPGIMGEFLADTFASLIRLGVPPGRINLGVQYSKKEWETRYNQAYRIFRELVVKKLKNEKWRTWLKTKCWSPCHNMRPENIKKLLENARSNGSRRIVISSDGDREDQVRPKFDRLYNMSMYAFEQREKASWVGRTAVECVYRKTSSNPVHESFGVIQAYYDFYGLKWPYNRRKYLEKLEGK